MSQWRSIAAVRRRPAGVWKRTTPRRRVALRVGRVGAPRCSEKRRADPDGDRATPPLPCGRRARPPAPCVAPARWRAPAPPPTTAAARQAYDASVHALAGSYDVASMTFGELTSPSNGPDGRKPKEGASSQRLKKSQGRADSKRRCGGGAAAALPAHARRGRAAARRRCRSRHPSRGGVVGRVGRDDTRPTRSCSFLAPRREAPPPRARPSPRARRRGRGTRKDERGRVAPCARV